VKRASIFAMMHCEYQVGITDGMDRHSALAVYRYVYRCIGCCSIIKRKQISYLRNFVF
jgi:hypothetical protein